jgi:hypothetical protein
MKSQERANVVSANKKSAHYICSRLNSFNNSFECVPNLSGGRPWCVFRKRFDYILLPTIAGYTGHTRYLHYPRILTVELLRQSGLPLVYELIAFETEY